MPPNLIVKRTKNKKPHHTILLPIYLSDTLTFMIFRHSICLSLSHSSHFDTTNDGDMEIHQL